MYEYDIDTCIDKGKLPGHLLPKDVITSATSALVDFLVSVVNALIATWCNILQSSHAVLTFGTETADQLQLDVRRADVGLYTMSQLLHILEPGRNKTDLNNQEN